MDELRYLGYDHYGLQLSIAGVKRFPVETGTTLIKKVSRVVEVREAAPTPTAPPLAFGAPVKRTITDTRSSTAFGACALRSSVTVKPYPEVSDFANFPDAASYFVISAGSTDAAGTCSAAYMYQTDNLVSVTA